MDKIICLGKNYLDHAREMRARGDAIPEKPVLFLKPPSAILQYDRKPLEADLPQGLGETHPECEVVLRLRDSGRRIEIADVTLGLDMTLRDVQAELKKKGQPWEIAKVFRHSAILGNWIPVSSFPDYLEHKFSFSVDGELRQSAAGREMRLLPEEAVAYASRFFELCDGDLLFTGTPAGVGPVRSGQIAELAWEPKLRFQVRWN